MQDFRHPSGHLTSRTPLAETLRAQDRVISREQLLKLDIGPKVIARLMREGWLHRRYRGIYVAASPILTRRGTLWAAHLATGGVLGYRSAAELHEIRYPYWKAELILPGHRKSPKTMVFHQGHLPPGHTQTLDGLPVTTVARTLLDLADVLAVRQLEQAINQAEVLQKYDHRGLEDVLSTANGRRGVTPLRHALEAHALGLTLTQSELEEEFLRLARDRGFAQPRTQFRIHDLRVDFAWPQQRIVIETDGAAFHIRLRSREEDARRDRVLRRLGWTVDRLSYRQVFFRPAEVAVILRETGVPLVASPRRRPPARRRRSAA